MQPLDYFYAVCQLLAGLGGFLLGFKILSGNTEKLATGNLRKWFDKTSKSKLAGMGIGALSTAIVQSSAVTTVMTIGLVNAGIMSLYQATAVIMGANIGTTITAQIVALQSFKFTEIAMALTFVGMFMNMLSKQDKVKSIGYILAGLGLVFLGLFVMSGAMSFIKNSQEVTSFLQRINNPFLLLFLGIIFTALMQSSSAVTSIIISMAATGYIVGGGGNSVLYLILGSNIGSCVTAIISCIGTGTNAKRAAVIHLLFNVFGVTIFMIMLLCWPKFMDCTFAQWFPLPATQIAMFHTFFNVICVALFLPFTKYFVKLATIIVPESKKSLAINKNISLLDERLLKTPAIAINASNKEAARMARTAMDALELAFDSFITKDTSQDEEISNLIKKTENMGKNITYFLVKISAKNISYNDEKLVSALHASLADIQRVAELADNLTKYTHHTIEDNLVFSDKVIGSLKEMLGQLKQLFVESMHAFADKDITAVKRAEEIENGIDDKRRELVADHIRRLNDGKCQPQSSGIFINLVGNLERAGDHLMYLAHSFDNI